MNKPTMDEIIVSTELEQKLKENPLLRRLLIGDVIGVGLINEIVNEEEI